MAKEKTSVFTTEFALKTDRHQARKLNLKFEALTSLYNQLLKFLLKQHEKLKKDNDYLNTIEKYRINKKALIKSQNRLFYLKKLVNKSVTEVEKQKEVESNLLQEEKIFSELQKEKSTLQRQFSDLNLKWNLDYPFLEKLSGSIKKNCWMADHLDSHTIQVIAVRVYDAYEKWRYKNGGKPRFKTHARGLKSISGKQNSCILIDKKGRVKWTTLRLDLFDEKDHSGFQAYAKQKIAEGKLKYSRIVRRTIKGKPRFFVQFVIEGKPFIKEKNKTPTAYIGKTVALDIGVSSVGVASTKGGFLFPFCPSVKDRVQAIKKIQRAMNRSARENNPDCFHETTYVKKVKHIKKIQGNVKKKSRLKQRSKNYLKLQAKLKDGFRKMETARNQEHYVLINQLLQLGLTFKIEKNAFKSWQRSWFGRTIGKKAPSGFQEKLISKVANTGGEVTLINPHQPKFSQYCHRCHSYHKKPLGQRIHVCESKGETLAQRDVYSAFLIYHYDLMKNKHQATQEDFEAFKDLTLKYSKDYFKLFPRRKDDKYHLSVNDMGGVVAGGKCQLTGEAKSHTFCAVEKQGFLAKSLTCKSLVKR